jgi:hypothetical protein
VDVRLKAMKDRKVAFSFEEWFDLETKMSEAYRLGLSGQWPRVGSLIQPLAVPALQKAYAVVLQTRRTAAEYLAASDQAEYMRGLYCYALDKLVSSHGQQEIFMLLSLTVTLSVAMQRITIKFEDLVRLRLEVVAEVVEALGIDNPAQLNPNILNPDFQTLKIKPENMPAAHAADRAIPNKPAGRPETFQEKQARHKAVEEAKRAERSAAKRAVRDQQLKVQDERLFMRALQGATRETFDRLLANVSANKRDMLYEELCDYRKPEPDRVAEAQHRIMEVVKRLDAKGIDLFEPVRPKAKKAVAKNKAKQKAGKTRNH